MTFAAHFGRVFRPPFGPAVSGISYLLYDQFITDLAAGSVNGTNAEPTGGVRTVVDTGLQLSIGGGSLIVGSGAGNPRILYSSKARVAGRVLIADAVATINDIYFGYGSSSSSLGNPNAFRIRPGSPNISTYENSSTIQHGTIVSGTSYKYAVVMRSTGAYYFIKGGVYTNWTLLWIGALVSTTPMYPIFYQDGGALSADNIRIPVPTWLPTPLAYDTFTRGDGAIGSSETTGPDGQVTPALTWTGGAISSNKLVITPTVGIVEALTDGGLENWINPTNLTSWTEHIAGASTVNRESSTIHGGSYAARFDIDALNNNADITQNVTMGWYSYSFWARLSTSTGNMYIRAGTFYWAYINLTSSYTQYTGTGRGSSVLLANNLLAGLSMYLDDVSLLPLTLSTLFSNVLTSDEDILISADLVIVARAQAGVATNLNSTTSPTAGLVAYHDGANVHLDKFTTVTAWTSLINTSATYVSGATIRVITYTSAGSLKVRVYYNNALIGTEQTVSDAEIIGNTIHGCFSTNSGNTFDNFTLFARGTGNEYSALDAY